MNEFLSKASSHLTGKQDIAEIDLEDVERLSHEHPYFSVGQALLAKKYKTENHSNFLSQVQKAAVFFNNPHWIHYQLLDAKPEIILSEQVEETKESVPIVEPAEEIQQPAEEVKTEDTETETVYAKDEILAASVLARETLSTIDKDEAPAEEIEITPDELHPEKEDILEEIQEEATVPQEDAGSIPPSKEEGSSTPLESGIEETFTEEAKPAEDPFVEKDLVTSVVENNLVQPVMIEEALEKTEPLQTEANVSVHTAQNQTKESANPKPVPNEPLIPIEPYYTVDYFASQGIKLVLDKNPQDKLGKQLRSFTDWLKHMKKLGPEDALKAPQDAEVDTAVKDSADTSNTPKEVLTEAMAEVLIKQGKKDKAIEVYNKLSFLNPDKSPYFADQIQKLKGT